MAEVNFSRSNGYGAQSQFPPYEYVDPSAGAPQRQPETPSASAFGGFNTGNVFNSWDLNPLSQQTGVSRDELSLQRDAFLRPLYSQYRSAFGPHADQGDQQLFGDPNFQTWARTGAGPQTPNQFDDPYTNQLESIAKAQMGQVRSNPGLDALMQFLTSQFQDLSQNPGFNTAEQSLLRTQAIDPIEADKNAAIKQAQERAAARGFAPSSGLMELDTRGIVDAANRARAAAGRDLGIRGIDQRNADLARALDLGQLLGLQIPGAQRNEELGLANLLYQLPRTAMLDANNIYTSQMGAGGDPFSQALQLLQQQTNQQRYSQQGQDAFLASIGDIIARLFG